MKTSFTSALLLLLVLLVGATHNSQAQTIRRVNNTGISGTNIYSTIAAAVTAAAAGDIIQVEPSETGYPSLILTKNVTVVGPGYFLDPSQNAGLQAIPTEATVGDIQFQAGSEGAYVAGLTAQGIFVGVSNITVQRCRVTSLIYLGYGTNGTPVALDNVTLKQNYINGITEYGSLAVTNLLITNNIFSGGFSLPTRYTGGLFHNVVLGGCDINNFSVANNYFTQAIRGVGNTLNNNLSAASNFPTTNGNRNSIAQSAVFVLAPGATAFDAWYQLRAGTNPARGAGQNGVDIGAFGGVDPYRLGGLPNIPAIYQQSQTIVGNSLNVTLSTRSNN